jgi:hypothetical protein
MIMPIELRCDGTMHGILLDDGEHLEVKCKRRTCGARPGVVILHTISLKSGRVVKTDRFNEPKPRKDA